MTVRRRKWRDAKTGAEKEAWSVDVQVIGKDGLIKRVRRVPRIQNRRAAEKLEHELRAELLAEDEAEPKVESPRFAEFAEKFLSTYASVNNRPSEVGSKGEHPSGAFGAGVRKMGLDEIGPKQIEGYKARKLDQRLSRKTINNHLTVLRKLLVVATEWKALDRVPPIQWLKSPPPEFDFLTFEEVPKFMEATEPEWRVMVTLALKTGLRLGELRALRWSDVDLEAGRLVVRWSITRGVITAPKNGRTREVPLSDQAAAALRAHPRLGELVFCNPDGSLLSKDQCKRVTYRSSARAGLRRLGWHCCRHYAELGITATRSPRIS